MTDMKKSVLFLGVICFVLTIFLCGCAENQDNNTISHKTYTWTARQLIDDIPQDLDLSLDYKLLYNSLKDGDTLIIQDTISNISYNFDVNTTTITFEWIEGEEKNSYDIIFEGNLTKLYQKNTNVNIQLTIKYVNFSYESLIFELEIFKEQWISFDEFIENGLKPLPSSCIKIV